MPVLAAAALATLILTPAVSVASGASPTVVSGVLSDASGSPTAGYVSVLAEPGSLPTAAGSAFTYVTVLGPIQTGADGSYDFTDADLAESPASAELKAFAAANDGWVNFVVVGETTRSMGAFYISRELMSGTWQSRYYGTTADVHATRTLTAAEARAYPFGGRTPNDPSPQCESTLEHSSTKWVRVGETHRWQETTAVFHYGKSADSDIDVGFQNEAGGWGIDGSVHIGTNTGLGFDTPDSHLNRTYFISKFLMGKYKVTWNGVGACAKPGQYVRAIKWIGGLQQGHTSGASLDGACNTVPSRYWSILDKNSGVTRDHTKAFHYGAAVSAYGASLGAVSGFSTEASYHYHTKPAEYICGASGHAAPGSAPNIAIGPIK